MNSDILKLARKFTIKLNKIANDPMKDPLLKKRGPYDMKIEPEMTEELDELVQDSLNIVILMERAFQNFQTETRQDDNVKVDEFVSRVLIDLEDIEDALTNPKLLDFDLNTESSYLDVFHSNTVYLKALINKTLDGDKALPEFRKLDHRVYKWVKELIDNSDKLYSKAMGQSVFMERYFMDPPNRMVERDSRDIDEINPSEIHIDYDDGGGEYLSDEAFDNAKDIENKLNKKYPDSDGFYSGLYSDIMREKERREWSSGKRHK